MPSWPHMEDANIPDIASEFNLCVEKIFSKGKDPPPSPRERSELPAPRPASPESKALKEAPPHTVRPADRTSSRDSSHPCQDPETSSLSPKRPHAEVSCLLSHSSCYLSLQREKRQCSPILQEIRVGKVKSLP
jgi:hypothetical protein